jgi:hypothetical protein
MLPLSSLLSSLSSQRRRHHKADCYVRHCHSLLPQMNPCISLYGGGRSVVVDGDRDSRHRFSAHVIIIQIILSAVFVFLGGQSEELDQTKAQ